MTMPRLTPEQVAEAAFKGIQKARAQSVPDYGFPLIQDDPHPDHPELREGIPQEEFDRLHRRWDELAKENGGEP